MVFGPKKRKMSLVILLVLSALIINAGYVYGYEVTYWAMDNGTTSPINVYSPSVLWDQTCVATTTPYAVATGTNHVISHQFFSPDNNLIMNIDPITYSTAFSCRALVGNLTGGSSLNDYYENQLETTFTSTTLNTWFRTDYDCDFDENEFFVYSSGTENDTFGNKPFGYAYYENQCCQCSAECTNDLTTDLTDLIDYMNGGERICGASLTKDRMTQSDNCNCAGTVNDMDINYWIAIPFNTMESGIVNISLNSISFSRLVGGAGSFDSDHQYYIVDVEDNTTWNLGTSSIPYSTSQTLVRNTDYWLFIGNRLYIDEQNWGSANNVIRYNF
jgi:hypothetical protein